MLDRIFIEIDKAFQTLFHKAISIREHPDAGIQDYKFNQIQQKNIAGLMRINHCGEICAQGLYQGQALTARDKSNQQAFEHAAQQETEHLAWTEQRLTELGGKTSILNPLFYAGSLAIGIGAGILGDKWNLGFLEETEKQVTQHLTDHLAILPVEDNKSRKILEQMRSDELEHANMAHNFGAAELPQPIKSAMTFTAKIMTTLTYRW